MSDTRDTEERTDPHLQIRDLAVQRGRVTVLQIDRLDLPRREVTVVIGPNGSGKSTLLGALQLVLHPVRGELLLDGEPMDRHPTRTRRRMAAAFQEPLLLSMSGAGQRRTAAAHSRRRPPRTS